MNAQDVLYYGHETVKQAVQDLPESAWETPGVVGVWSVKDVLAHLASFEQLLVDVLHSLQDDTPTPTLDRFISLGNGRFNDVEVAERQSWRAAEVWQAYEAAAQQAQTLLAQIPLTERRRTGALPWYGAEYDLEDYLAYANYGHKREHCAQIGVFRDQTKQ